MIKFSEKEKVAIKSFQNKVTEAYAQRSLADTYINDGALFDGADNLQKAANLFREAAELRRKFLFNE